MLLADNFHHKKLKIVQNIFDKLQVLNTKERQLADVLTIPNDAHCVAKINKTSSADEDFNLRTFVSCPSSSRCNQDREHLETILMTSSEARAGRPQNSHEPPTNMTVCAPGLHDTHETIGLEKIDEVLLRFESSSEHNTNGDSNLKSPPTDGTTRVWCEELGLGLPLQQCAPGPREEVLRYRKELMNRCLLFSYNVSYEALEM